MIPFVGGQGGASSPDIYHSDYGGYGSFNCKLTRSGNTFTVSWTYNELDYNNTGGGSYNISSIFPLLSSGALDTTDTNEYITQTVYNYYGRDARDLAFGSKVINGNREFWFCSNGKSNTTMTLGNTMTYAQSFWVSRSLIPSNSARVRILDTLTGGASNGTVTGL